MKITFELPASLLTEAESRAASQGQPLDRYISSALQEKLAAEAKAVSPKPWLAYAGLFKAQRDESPQILATIEEACETTRPEDWS